jgi:hypothetical protein
LSGLGQTSQRKQRKQKQPAEGQRRGKEEPVLQEGHNEGTKERNRHRAVQVSRSLRIQVSRIPRASRLHQSLPEEEPTRKRASSESDSSGVKKGRSDRGKRAKVGRPKKQAKKENIQKVSAFGAAIDKGKRSEASLVAPVQCAIVQARLHKKAKIADGQSDIGKKKGEQASGTAR